MLDTEIGDGARTAMRRRAGVICRVIEGGHLSVGDAVDLGGDDTAPLGLEEAYAVETPHDNRLLYASWAATYESGFTEAKGYRYHEHVADAFVAGRRPDGPVLDVGCGTGLVGLALRQRGVGTIDGVDISPEMLAEARAKQADGAVYRYLIDADLTQPLAMADDVYAGLVSAGTFTHGHLPPDPLDELIRAAMAGARAAIGINAAHFEELGFAAWFDAAVADGRIGPYEIVTIPVYENSSTNKADDMSNVVVFSVR